MSSKLPKIFTILFILFIILQTFSFLFLNLFYLPALAEADWKIPELQISIPTLDLTDPKPCPPPNQDKMCVPWIGQYIAGVYRYAIGIVGILATVVMMVGGIMWIVAGGNAARVGEAKAWIGASLTGLVLALSSYMILYQINPKLTQFEPIKVAGVKPTKELVVAAKLGSDTNCGGCEKFETCIFIESKLHFFKEYECLSTLPGKCTVTLKCIRKGGSEKYLTYFVNTTDELKCLEVFNNYYQDIIKDPAPYMECIFENRYQYTPK